MMNIGVPRETKANETRVAIVPAMVKELLKIGSAVRIESDAGSKAHFTDKQYADAGATVVKDAKALYKQSDV
ncbi:MAG: NAD(P)(+) transhydrogenase (Re/Si-specific) subunit alpha, partial [Candidatus Altiarchaeota archaeon]|nr:NAD(P)(+) transhydrogenase (Re/Si-specific) subunit alpha [Candidatus Altiarchaeota archaeon]